ncbi:MAG: hypothetical protein ACJ72B_06210 [Ornithinibacter sp.]
MTDVGIPAPDVPDERPPAPLPRDPPPPPGYINPVEQSELLEQPGTRGDEA